MKSFFYLLIITLSANTIAESYFIAVSTSEVDSLYAFQFSLTLPLGEKIVSVNAGRIFAGRECFVKASNDNPSLIGVCVLGGGFVRSYGAAVEIATIHIESATFPAASISKAIARLRPDGLDSIHISLSAPTGGREFQE